MAGRYRVNLRYTERQVRDVLRAVGIEIHSETSRNFICFCPFHSNRSSPAFAVSKTTGLYFCFNSSCDGNSGGRLDKMVQLVTDGTESEVNRLITTHGIDQTPLTELLDEEWAINPEFVEVPQMVIDDYMNSMTQEALGYMIEERGFNEETLNFFNVGYDEEHNSVVVPITHHANGKFIGTNSRRIDRKEFRLSEEFPRNKFLFNLNNSKRFPTVIVCESQFDAMKIHEAGFPNAVCSLGSYVSEEQLALLRRYHTKLIIMTDRDAAGRKLGKQLAASLPSLDVSWAVWKDGIIYPRDCKDAGDMTKEEIKICLTNSVSDWEYQSADLFDN